MEHMENIRGIATEQYDGMEILNSLPYRMTLSDTAGNMEMRKTLLEDAVPLFHLVQHNPDIPSHVAWAKNVTTVDEVIPSMQRLSNMVMDGRYVITENSEILGALWAFPGDKAGEFGIGYCLDKAARGKGIASAAVTSMLEMLKTRGASQVYFQIVPSNANSAAIPKRLGCRQAESVMGRDFPVLQQRWRLDLRNHPQSLS